MASVALVVLQLCSQIQLQLARCGPHVACGFGMAAKPSGVKCDGFRASFTGSKLSDHSMHCTHTALHMCMHNVVIGYLQQHTVQYTHTPMYNVHLISWYSVIHTNPCTLGGVSVTPTDDTAIPRVSKSHVKVASRSHYYIYSMSRLSMGSHH